MHLEADTAAVGAAMLAAAAAGHGDAAGAAIAGLVDRAARFDPHPSDALAVRRAWFREVRASAAVRVEEAA